MQFAELKPFFEDNTIWNSGYEIYWYELIWETLKSNQLIDTKMNENRQEAYFLAIALVDLYREFTQYSQEEYWSEGELIIDSLEAYDYKNACALLGIAEMTINDFCEREGMPIEILCDEEIQQILKEESPGLVKMYFSYAADRYRNRVLFAIKQVYDFPDLFSFMVHTFGSTCYNISSFEDGEEVEEVEEESVEDIESFKRTALSNQDIFLNDMSLMSGFEWLSMIIR